MQEINKLVLIFLWKCKEPGIAKIASKRKVEVEGYTWLNYKTKYNVIVIEPTWYWVKHNLVHQRKKKKTEHLEVDSHILNKWIFHKDVKVFDYEKFFSTSDAGKIKYQI